MILSRTEIEKKMHDATVGSLALPDLRDWLIGIIAGDDVESVESDIDLAMTVVYALENAPDDVALLALCNDLASVLARITDNAVAEDIVHLVLGRRYVEGVIQKYLEGVVSRVQFVSFLAKRQWPKRLCTSLLAMEKPTLAAFAGSLASRDYNRLSSILLSRGEPRRPAS